MRRVVAVVAITGGVTALAAGGLAAGVFEGFQHRANDALFPAAPNSPQVTVVGIDRRSLASEGVAWPWPRSLDAQLVSQLAKAGASVIVLDVVFAPSRPGDDQLAAALRSAPSTVIAEAGSVRPGSGTSPGTFDNVTPPVPAVADATSSVGHAQATEDPNDGVVRSLPLVLQSPDGKVVPSLALATTMRWDAARGPIKLRPSAVQVGDRVVPTGESKTLQLNFSSRLTNPSNAISAVDVLQGTVPAAKLTGKIVLVGVTDPTLGDQKLVPTDKSGGLPGVMVHANAVNTMITGAYLAPVSNAETLLWVAALGALASLAVLTLPIWLSPVLAALLGLGYLLLAFVRFDSGHQMDLVYPFVGLALGFVAGLAVRYIFETRRQRRVSALFSQYVPNEVARRLVEEDRVGQASEGERLDITVLFCDLRGFTALSSTLPPARIRVMLNHYYERLTDIILDLDGTVMQYVGDEVFAVFGAPLPSDDNQDRALRCATAMQRLTPSLDAELRAKDVPPVRFGIGLHAGEAVAAHFGGGKRRQYGVVGDTVNVGSRLCSVAGPEEIVCSWEVFSRVSSPPAAEEIGPVELKGVTRPLRLFRIRVGEAAAPEREPAEAGRD